MADLTITAANVIADPGAKIAQKVAAAAITAGASVYLSSETGKVGLYDADVAGDASVLYGVAVNGAAVGQVVCVAIDGTLAIGAIVAVGTLYLGSDTAGGIRPVADLNSGDAVGVLGVGISTSKIALNIWNTGVVKA
jgi:hypothetical protein